MPDVRKVRDASIRVDQDFGGVAKAQPDRPRSSEVTAK